MPHREAELLRPGSSSSNRRAALWSIPAASIVGAVALQLITRPIDTWLTERGTSLPTLLDRGGADDLRAVLGTIAGAAITVLGLVLSITMVTVTLAATQLGPRLVRNFLTSRVTKATIGIFIALFVYSILTLDSISTNDPTRPALLPELGTTVALLGSIAAILCLVWYVHSVARSIQVSYVVEVVVRNLDDTIDALRDDHRRSGEPVGGPTAVAAATSPPGAELRVGRSGYVQRIEHRPLTAAASAAGAVLELLVRPGDFVVDGSPVVRVHPPEAAAAVRDACEHYLDVGPNRTLDQDVEFALDQLVEIALRALSPAINDTFTALTCLDWISEALLRMDAELDDDVVHADATGAVRLIERSRPFPRIVKSAYEKVRQAGAANPAVAVRLLDSIGRVAGGCQRPERREALRHQADLALEAALAAIPLAADRDDVAARHAAVVARLS